MVIVCVNLFDVSSVCIFFVVDIDLLLDVSILFVFYLSLLRFLDSMIDLVCDAFSTRFVADGKRFYGSME